MGSLKEDRILRGPVLKVLLADAALELPPEEVRGHPAVRKHAHTMGRRPGEVLLDQNVHRPAIARLPDAKRRGRPDIVQYTLLTLLESPLAKAGGLEVAVHTVGGMLLRVRSDTRLPRGEARFQGLLAKVLLEGASQAAEPLLWSDGVMEPAQALGAFASGDVVRLDEHGPLMEPRELVGRGKDLSLVLGAFPSGDWSDAWKRAAPDTASLWPEPLNAWAVAAECVAAYRARWGPDAQAKPREA